ncbi:SWIM zinc finger family protein [Halobellus rubicundus]|uniref:SWIM zinc finger family protein n=1 Tax=Halobellus rubicundus TaxID=2996466 RepID=A0ABD5MDT8_9EURY
MSSSTAAASGSDATTPDAQMLQDLAQLDERDVRALTEPMDVYADDPDCWGSDEVAVYHEGRQRMVNIETRSCDCEDAYYNHAICKHVRRAEFALGRREIPDGIRTEALDDGLRTRLQEADRL